MKLWVEQIPRDTLCVCGKPIESRTRALVEQGKQGKVYYGTRLCHCAQKKLNEYQQVLYDCDIQLFGEGGA